jgi:hypothetical protein
MAILNPPPLQLPSQLVEDREVAGFFDGLLRTVYQVWSQVFSLQFQEKTTTNDSTVTALQRVDVPTGKSVFVEARVVARRTGGSSGSDGDSAGYIRAATFKNISGTVSLVGSVASIYTAEDQAGWDCGFAISGTQAVLVGTGANNNNITWESFVSFYEVGV